MLKLKTNIKSEFAKSFLKEVTEQKNSYYLFFGNNEFSGTDLPYLIDSIKNENDAKKSMLFAYQITEKDCSLAIRKNIWEQYKIYDEYVDTLDQSKPNNFYVTRIDEGKYRVYKCIKNGNNNPQGSVAPPYGTSTENFISVADGYIWKFMYEVPEELEKFITNEFIPVPIVDNITYSDERSLQVTVQLDTKPGTIENMIIVPISDGSNIINDNDLINTEFLNDECQVLSTDINSNGNLLISVKTSTPNTLENPIFLSDENNYYNNKYYIIFQKEEEGEIVATIKTYTVTESGTLAIFELCEITGNASNITIGSKYSIVPKIEVRGDGNDCVAVPRFFGLNLVGIDIISGGTGYNKANARFLIDIPFSLVPVISPRKGHGFSAYEELGARTLLINKNITLHTGQAVGETKYFFGNGYDINQFGIIKDIEDNTGQPFVSTILPKGLLTLISESATVRILLSGYEEVTDPVFRVGDVISRGPSFKRDQFRGKIILIESTIDGLELVCEILNGMFDNYPTYPIQNETTGQTFNLTETDGFVSTSMGVFTSNDVTRPRFVFGKDSLFVAEIDSVVQNNENTNILSLRTNKINGSPKKLLYSSVGSLVFGEPVILLEETTNQTEIIDDVGTFRVFDYETDLATIIGFNYSYLTNVPLIADSLVPAEMGEENIPEGEYIGKYLISANRQHFGKIISIVYSSPQNDGGYEYANFYVKMEKGDFTNLQNPKLYVVEDSPYSFDIFSTELTDINANILQNPTYYENINNLNINSGKVVYLQNINEVSLADNQAIEVNVVLTF
jgi:hypothetical protein